MRSCFLTFVFLMFFSSSFAFTSSREVGQGKENGPAKRLRESGSVSPRRKVPNNAFKVLNDMRLFLFRNQDVNPVELLEHIRKVERSQKESCEEVPPRSRDDLQKAIELFQNLSGWSELSEEAKRIRKEEARKLIPVVRALCRLDQDGLGSDRRRSISFFRMPTLDDVRRGTLFADWSEDMGEESTFVVRFNSEGRLLSLEINGEDLLCGYIPPCIGELTTLGTLSLSEGNMSGTLPLEMRGLKNLVVLELSHLGLGFDFQARSWIPFSKGVLSGMQDLVILNIGGNYFQELPRGEIDSLPKLEFLVTEQDFSDEEEEEEEGSE